MAFVKTLLSTVVVVGLLFIDRYYGNAENVRCKDDRGQAIDWFIAYKLPTLLDPTSSDGNELAYLDTRSSNWRLLRAKVSDDVGNPLAYTLSGIYSSKGNSTMYAMYNDQVPDDNRQSEGYSMNFGHTKGVVHFDEVSGYWMIHSVPHFPLRKTDGAYEYPSSGLVYGQIFLCISLDYSNLNTIGELFLINRPQFYDYSLPPKFEGSNPNLTSALRGKYHKFKDLFSKQMVTMGGQVFEAFAKSAKYIYGDLWVGIAKYLKSNLVVETWRKGGPNLPPSCKSKYKVENVLGMKLLNLKFNLTHDHSKWAVSKKVKKMYWESEVENMYDINAWSCVGDINRQPSQSHRGGGAVCFNHKDVALNFQNTLENVELC